MNDFQVSEEELRQSAAECDAAMRRIEEGEGIALARVVERIARKLNLDFKQ